MNERKPANRLRILALVLLLLGLVLWCVRLFETRSSERRGDQNANEQAAASIIKGGGGKGRQAVTNALASSAEAPSLGTKLTSEAERYRCLDHVPLDFYGKVLDQYDQPVVGAEITAMTIYRTGLQSGMEKLNAVTDLVAGLRVD